MKKTAALLVVCAVLCLAGCGAGGGEPAGKTAEQPALLGYYNTEGSGVINSEGTMIVAPEPGFGWYAEIINDEEGRQRFAMQIETIYQEEEDYQSPIVAKIFRFYDPWGKLVREQRIDMPRIAPGNGIEFRLAVDGGLEDGCFLVNTFAGDGGYHIYDINGDVLVDKQVYDVNEPLRYSYAYIELGDGFMIVNYECTFDERAEGYGADVYTTAGEPVAMAKDYDGIWRLWDYVNQRSSGYYVARYWGDGERYLCDLLDDRLQLVIGGFESIDGYGGGAMTVGMDGMRGLMNMRGEWLYREPVDSAE